MASLAVARPLLLGLLLAVASLAEDSALAAAIRGALADRLASPAEVNTTGPAEVNGTASWDTLPQAAQIGFGVILLLLGGVVVFLGYRLLRLSVFVFGGFICSLFMFGILGAAIPDDTANKATIVFWTCLGVWAATGFIFACCLQLAIFVLGFSMGTCIALALNPVALQYIWPAHIYANLFIWIIILGIACGILVSCCFQRPLMIVTTSAGGSLMVVCAIAMFSGGMKLVMLDGQNDFGGPTAAEWGAFAAWIVLTAVGSLVQFFVTASGHTHDWIHGGKDL